MYCDCACLLASNSLTLGPGGLEDQQDQVHRQPPE